MASITLSKLLDLAIGTPEVGAVNFNVLYRLLQAMISKLELKDLEIDISDIDRRDFGGSKLLALEGTGHESPYHQLERKVSFVYNQIEQFQALPSTKQLSNQVLGDNENAVSYMWQYMQLKKKVDANEEGVDKLMSMINDLMKQIDYLQTSNTALIKRLGDLDLQSLATNIDDLHQSIENLTSQIPSEDEMNKFVTWNYLENALNGLARPKTSLAYTNFYGYYDQIVQMKPEERQEFVESAIKNDVIHQYFPKIDDEILRVSPEDRKNFIEDSVENDNIKNLLAQSGSDLLRMSPKERQSFIEDAMENGTLRIFLPALDKNFEVMEPDLRSQTIEDSIKEGVLHKYFPCKYQSVSEMNVAQKKASIQSALDHGTLEELLPGVNDIQNVDEFLDKAAHEGIIEAFQEVTGSQPPPLSNLERELEKEILKECQTLMYEENGNKETELAKEDEMQDMRESELRNTSAKEDPAKRRESMNMPTKEKRMTPPRAGSAKLSQRKQSSPAEQPKRVTPQSRPPSCRPWSSASSLSVGPSLDLVDILERLGKLYDHHNKLVTWVNDIKKHIKLKANNSDLKELDERVRKLEEMLEEKLEKGDLDELSGVMSLLQDEIESIKQLMKDLTGKEPVVVKSSLPDIGQLVETRLSDSAAFAELIQRLGVLETKIADFQESLKRRDSAYSSEYSSLQDSMSEISNDLDRRRKKKEKPQSIQQLDDDGRFANVVEGSITHDIIKMIADTMETGGQDVGDRLKRLGLILDDQLGEVKDKIEILDEDLKLMAKGIEIALQKAKDAEEAERLRAASSSKTPDSTADIDSEALLETQKVLQFLREDIGKLYKTTGEIITVNNQKQKEIEQLYEHKADKDYVLGEFDVKADKRQLEAKVNFSLFNKTTDEINKTIREFEAKLEGNESAMQNIFGQLSEDVDGKLDKFEMDPLKGWIDSRLRELNKKIAKSQPGWTEDDAAGLRKQLIQRFHCLSCDRNVNMISKDPVASLPKPSGMPVTRSARPYTIFELDQIRQRASKGIINQSMVNFERALMERQMARIKKSDLKAFLVHYSNELEALGMKREVALAGNNEMSDSYATTRACGGIHTMTFPHRRLIRISNRISDEEREHQSYRQCGEESDVQGADGIIYKGRTGYADLSHGSKGAKVLRKAIPSSASQPLSGSSSRPGSARNRSSQRPSSARAGSRPSSARPNSVVQTFREEEGPPLNVAARAQTSENA